MGYWEYLFSLWGRRIFNRGVVWFDLCLDRSTACHMENELKGTMLGEGRPVRSCYDKLKGKAGGLDQGERQQKSWEVVEEVRSSRASPGEEPASQLMTQGQVGQNTEANPGLMCQKPRKSTKINATRASRQTEMDSLQPCLSVHLAFETLQAVSQLKMLFWRERDCHHYHSPVRAVTETLPDTACCWTFLKRRHKVWFCRTLLDYYNA